MKVTITIPLRLSEGLFEGKNRLARIIENVPHELFDILIVDYGSQEPYRQQIADFESSSVKIVRVDVEGKTFSIGHARDIGVQFATNDVVMFHDIDFLANPDMYHRIYAEVMSRDIANNAYRFFCVPVFFLTKEGSDLFCEQFRGTDYFNTKFQTKLIELQKGIVEFPAFGSSAIVVNKWHYLSIGGHNKEFFGHGAEDYEILHRLAHYYKRGPRTADYYLDTKSNLINEYRGFRAFFALYGIDVFQKGMYFVHVWHPTRKLPNYNQSQRNFALLGKLMKDFDNTRENPPALSDLSRSEKSLVLVEVGTSVHKALRQVYPCLGDFDCMKESSFKDKDELLDFLKNNGYTSVGFLNPYANIHRKNLYFGIKEAGLKFWVFDRGGLPDSWFFDSGFNSDSLSYLPEKWDHALSPSERAESESYINWLTNSDQTLEVNGARKSALFVREKLNIGKRKMIFVPMQRPSDTVTTEFAGDVGSVGNFTSWINVIAGKLDPKKWVVVVKQHPLEEYPLPLQNVTIVPPDTHVYDLIEASDAVLLINSGVGLISLAFEKPVICTGVSYYSHDGLAMNASSIEEVIKMLHKLEKPDREKVFRFFYHLLVRVYSFGDADYKDTPKGNGSSLRIVNKISFRTLVINGFKKSFGKQEEGITLDAPLFYSFGGRTGIKTSLEKPTPPLQNAQRPSKPKEATPKVAPPTTSSINKQPSVNDTSTSSMVAGLFESKKVKKLVREPDKFFKDMLDKRISNFSKYIGK